MNAKGTTTKQKDQRQNVKWKSPPMGQIKGNFDGSAKGNMGKMDVEVF